MNIAPLQPFQAIAISRIAHELAEQGRSVIHMEFGQPSTSAPAAAIAEAHRVLDAEAMGYWESNALKERIARYYHDAHGVAVDREQVILTCGASPAFVLALSCLFAPGARVALEAAIAGAIALHWPALRCSPQPCVRRRDCQLVKLC